MEYNQNITNYQQVQAAGPLPPPPAEIQAHDLISPENILLLQQYAPDMEFNQNLHHDQQAQAAGLVLLPPAETQAHDLISPENVVPLQQYAPDIDSNRNIYQHQQAQAAEPVLPQPAKTQANDQHPTPGPPSEMIPVAVRDISDFVERMHKEDVNIKELEFIRQDAKQGVIKAGLTKNQAEALNQWTLTQIAHFETLILHSGTSSLDYEAREQICRTTDNKKMRQLSELIEGGNPLPVDQMKQLKYFIRAGGFLVDLQPDGENYRRYRENLELGERLWFRIGNAPLNMNGTVTPLPPPKGREIVALLIARGDKARLGESLKGWDARVSGARDRQARGDADFEDDRFGLFSTWGTEKRPSETVSDWLTRVCREALRAMDWSTPYTSEQIRNAEGLAMMLYEKAVGFPYPGVRVMDGDAEFVDEYL